MSVNPHWNNQAPLQESFKAYQFRAAGPPLGSNAFEPKINKGTDAWKIMTEGTTAERADYIESVWNRFTKKGNGHHHETSTMAGDMYDEYNQDLQSGGLPSFWETAGPGGTVSYGARTDGGERRRKEAERQGLRQWGQFDDGPWRDYRAENYEIIEHAVGKIVRREREKQRQQEENQGLRSSGQDNYGELEYPLGRSRMI